MMAMAEPLPVSEAQAPDPRRPVLEFRCIDVRFDTRELERFVVFLKSRYGAPVTETKDTYQRKDRGERHVYKVLWEDGKQRAVLTAQLEKRRASMLVSRGNFEEEIYLVR